MNFSIVTRFRMLLEDLSSVCHCRRPSHVASAVIYLWPVLVPREGHLCCLFATPILHLDCRDMENVADSQSCVMCG